MKRCPPSRFFTVLSAALLVSLMAFSVYAQVQTGNIYGHTQAKDGSALPGVTVTLTGVGAPQTFVTDGTGAFRFLNLSPGTYALKAELAGFGISTRQGISVNLGRNADVTMTLNPAASESITVTAEAPLLDVRKAGTGATITKVELEKVPSGRDPWVILQQTPGVLIDRINVGGNESGQQSNYVGKGTVGSQSTWNVDGVNITDVGALGSSPTYYDFDSFEEMQITTGGTDPRIQTPGVQLNMVTKRGTNDIKGSGRYFNTGSGLQANPRIPSEATGYLAHVNQIDNIDDYGAEIGGPIIKDKLWLWGAYSNQQINLLTATVLSSGSRFLDKTKLENENLKINAQPFASNSLSFSDSYGNKVKLGRNVGPSRFPETSWNQSDHYDGGAGSLTDPTLWKLEDTQIVNPNLYFTGLYSKVQGGFRLIADNGKGCKDLACGLNSLPSYLGTDGAYHRTYESYDTIRPQTQYRVDSSAFLNTGSINHELKFGFGYRKADVRSISVWPGDQYTVDFGDGTGGVYLFRPTDFTYSVKSNDAYVGDTIMVGNLTLQAGLRYDLQKGSVQGGSTKGNSVLGAAYPPISWNSVSGLKWDSISPRLGLTYTLGADKKTLLRAAYSRYVDQLGGTTVYHVSPGGYQYLYYYFNDKNKNLIADPGELTDFQFAVGVDPNKLTVANQMYRWDKKMNPPHTDELILGFEREIVSDLSVGVNGTYRKLDDFIWNAGEKTQGSGNFYSPSDYVQKTVIAALNCTGITAAPCTKVGFLPGGETSHTFTYYQLKAGTPAPIYYVITNRPDYHQTYEGVEFTATKRMSNRWMLRGNVTLQDWKQHVGSGAIIDPTRNRGSAAGAGANPGWVTGCITCDGSEVLQGSGSGSGSKGGVYINSKWAYNLTGVYQIPVVETSLGFNLTGRQGYPIPYDFRVNVPGEGFKYILAEDDTDKYRHENLTELDLRLAKDIRISRAGITVSVDAFNILNKNTILQRDVRRLNQSVANHITEIQSPRVFRLGARVTF